MSLRFNKPPDKPSLDVPDQVRDALPMGRYRTYVCLRGIPVIRPVCRPLGVGLSVVSGSWIALVPC
jgi:hypothetical protein